MAEKLKFVIWAIAFCTVQVVFIAVVLSILPVILTLVFKLIAVLLGVQVPLANLFCVFVMAEIAVLILSDLRNQP